MPLSDDYAKLYAFAMECERALSFASADAQAMGVKNALSVLKLGDAMKPEAVSAELAPPPEPAAPEDTPAVPVAEPDPDPAPAKRKTK